MKCLLRSFCSLHLPSSICLLVLVIDFWSLISYAQAIEFCSIQNGGGMCPTGNTCCRYQRYVSSAYPRTPHALSSDSSACIPNDLGSYNATCCYDDIHVIKVGNSTNGGSNVTLRMASNTGCPVGYTCAIDDETTTVDSDNQEHRQFCRADDTFDDIDSLLPTLPRYPLHPCPQIQNVYGFSMWHRNNINQENDTHTDETKLAYYSSHGDIQQRSKSATTEHWNEAIRLVVIMIHGANRNAEDYFCSLQAIVQQQQQHQPIHPSEVVLLVPWFLSTTDRPSMSLVNGGIPFRWDTSHDVSGPWRYGADAITPTSSWIETSSFALLDTMISYLFDASDAPQFPNMQRLVVAGHSSGGQFVQRWSMVTHTWDEQRMKSIVANPSSYAYLTPMRHMDIEWRVPNDDELSHCPDYNEWEWGIGTILSETTSTSKIIGKSSSMYILPPYVKNALTKYGSVSNLTTMFSKRDVVYLAGGLDVCNIPDTKNPNGWCNSHGLETSCRDMIQGSNRLERHHWYCASLQQLNISHRCFVVPYVGHDHALMFSSSIGTTALFGSIQMQNMFGMKIDQST